MTAHTIEVHVDQDDLPLLLDAVDHPNLTITHRDLDGIDVWTLIFDADTGNPEDGMMGFFDREDLAFYVARYAMKHDLILEDDFVYHVLLSEFDADHANAVVQIAGFGEVLVD